MRSRTQMECEAELLRASVDAGKKMNHAYHRSLLEVGTIDARATTPIFPRAIMKDVEKDSVDFKARKVKAYHLSSAHFVPHKWNCKRVGPELSEGGRHDRVWETSAHRGA